MWFEIVFPLSSHRLRSMTVYLMPSPPRLCCGGMHHPLLSIIVASCHQEQVGVFSLLGDFMDNALLIWLMEVKSNGDWILPSSKRKAINWHYSVVLVMAVGGEFLSDFNNSFFIWRGQDEVRLWTIPLLFSSNEWCEFLLSQILLWIQLCTFLYAEYIQSTLCYVGAESWSNVWLTGCRQFGFNSMVAFNSFFATAETIFVSRWKISDETNKLEQHNLIFNLMRLSCALL